MAKILTALLGVVVFVPSLFAGVNVNNGNFYIAYTDLFLQTSGLNIEIARTYNSRSSWVRGYFGVGWSSELDSYLSVQKSNIRYHEAGGGNTVVFTPEKNSKGQVLKNRWSNSIFGPQKITQRKKDFLLEAANSKLYFFSLKGQLKRIADRNKNYIDLVYENNLPVRLKDNNNVQVVIRWNTQGKMPRIASIESGEAKATYKYDKVGNLISVVGADGIPYRYEYDNEHNMTKIAYQNGTYKELRYNKLKDWVKYFREEDGNITEYDYVSDKLDPENKFGTIVSRYKNPRQKDTARFWYEFKRRSDGTRYNYRTVSLLRDQVTETIFTECCGTPQVIAQWDWKKKDLSNSDVSWTQYKGKKAITKFDYYQDGLLKKKTSPNGFVTQIAYDKVHRKVSKVIRGGRTVEYHYDRSGNLAWAYDHLETRKLEMNYDVQGRIKMVTERKVQASKEQVRKIYFGYNAYGQPNRIKEVAANGANGSIRMAYGPGGRIREVLDSKGRSLASERDIARAQRIAATFENLLEIVNPTGISLSPEG